MERYAMIALGGALGAIARYQVTLRGSGPNARRISLGHVHGKYHRLPGDGDRDDAAERGALLIGAANAIGSIVAGYAALWLGVVLARSF